MKRSQDDCHCDLNYDNKFSSKQRKCDSVVEIKETTILSGVVLGVVSDGDVSSIVSSELNPEKNVDYVFSEKANQEYRKNFRYNDFRVDVGDFQKQIRSPYLCSPGKYEILRKNDKSNGYTLLKDEFRIPNALALALALAEKKAFDSKIMMDKCNQIYLIYERQVEEIIKSVESKTLQKKEKLCDLERKKNKALIDLQDATSVYEKYKSPTISIDDVGFWLFGFWEIAIEIMPKQDVLKSLKESVHKLWTYEYFSPVHFVCNCFSDPDCGWINKLGDDKASRKLRHKRKKECKPLVSWLKKMVDTCSHGLKDLK